jgi:hypothetical protein
MATSMLWLHRSKQGQMAHRYKVRTGHAQVLQRDTADQSLLTANISLIRQGFESADVDEHEFATLFDEPMPEHLRIAAHLEADLWLALRTTLESARATKLTTEEYHRLVPHLRQELTTLLKLLDLEQEMLYSPLTKRFTDQVKLLRQVHA